MYMLKTEGLLMKPFPVDLLKEPKVKDLELLVDYFQITRPCTPLTVTYISDKVLGLWYFEGDERYPLTELCKMSILKCFPREVYISD